jgi:hypothetical protein
MTTSVSISLTAVDEHPRRNLPCGVVHVGEVVRLVLKAHGLSLGVEPGAELRTPPRAPPGLVEMSLAALEAVLASNLGGLEH